MSSFFVQASSPIVEQCRSPTETTLEHAIETAFVSDTEDAFLNWQGVSIPLSYKYDISIMIEDLMFLIGEIKSADVGNLKITWPSNTFQAVWQVSWADGRILCQSEWHSVSGNIEGVLRATESIEMDIQDFLSEWKAPLQRVIEGLHEAGYNGMTLAGLKELEQLHSDLEGCGRLYASQPAQ